MRPDRNMPLGLRMYSQNVVLKGSLAEDGWKAFLRAAAKALGMNPCGQARVWRYPVDGEGGNGMTIVQPITESFLYLDTWSDHDGAYLHISSCRQFDALDLVYAIQGAGLGLDALGRHEVMGFGVGIRDRGTESMAPRYVPQPLTWGAIAHGATDPMPVLGLGTITDQVAALNAAVRDLQRRETERMSTGGDVVDVEAGDD